MNMYENFDINKAKELSYVYKKKRNFAKERFVNKLISYQYFFSNTSIVGANLYLVEYYKRNTVEAVLSDLNYKLISFSHPVNEGYLGGKKTNLSFIPEDSAEG